MTSALRRRHRIAVSGLALVLPAGVALALAARPAPPGSVALAPAPGDDVSAAPPTVAWQGLGGDASATVIARVGRPSSDDRPALLDLDVRSATGRPELLVYWSPARSVGEQLPADAILLGSVADGAPRRFALPEAARARAGRVLLYAIARGALATAVDVPAADTIPGDRPAGNGRDGGLR